MVFYWRFTPLPGRKDLAVPMFGFGVLPVPSRDAENIWIFGWCIPGFRKRPGMHLVLEESWDLGSASWDLGSEVSLDFGIPRA